MTRERFGELLRELAYDEATIDRIWASRPSDEVAAVLTEVAVRRAAKQSWLIKDRLLSHSDSKEEPCTPIPATPDPTTPTTT